MDVETFREVSNERIWSVFPIQDEVGSTLTVSEFLDAGKQTQGLAVTVEAHVDDVIAERFLDVVQIAVQDAAATVNEEDAIAQLLHPVHLMRRQQHSHAFFSEFADEVLDQILMHRVESGKRLVEDNEIWTM